MNASDVAAMSPDERRVRIAEICGVKPVKHNIWGSNGEGGFVSIGLRDDWSDSPNYPEDLNAMADAERTMSNEQHSDFRDKLHALIKPTESLLRDAYEKAQLHERRYVSATAAQRAEAFLRVMG